MPPPCQRSLRPCPATARRWRLVALALSLATVATPTTLRARPRTAVIERLDLVAAAPGVRIDITVDRPLAWTVGREADGRLRIEVPNARPGYGVVSRLFPGGLVEEIRIVAAGIPSRPLTQMIVTTRGVADHRFDVDGAGFRLELVPTGLQFPSARPAPPIEPLQPPPAASAVVTLIVPAPVEILPAEPSRVEPSAAAPPMPSSKALEPAANERLEASPVESDTSDPTAIALPIVEMDESEERLAAPATLEDDPVPVELPTDPPLDASPPPAPIVEPASVASLEEWDLDLPEALPLPSSTGRAQRIELQIEPANEAGVEAAPVPGADPLPKTVGDIASQRTPAPDSAGELEPPRVASPPPLLEKATQVLTISPLAPGVLGIAGDGGFEFTGFRLENPERFVIDLHGVVNHSDLGALDIGQGLLLRVRVSQYRTSPTPITRVIFDLREPTVPAIESASDGLLVRFVAAAPDTERDPVGSKPPR